MKGAPFRETSDSPLKSELSENKIWLEQAIKNCGDVSVTSYHYGPELQFKALVVYFETLVQNQKINLLKSALQDLSDHSVGQAADITPDEVMLYFERKGVSAQSAATIERTGQALEAILSGQVLVFFDRWNKALRFDAFSIEERTVSEPITEPVIKGPHNSTTENLKKNAGLLRARLKTADFKLEFVQTKGKTNTEFVFGYVEGVVDSETLCEFRKRIAPLKEQEVLGISYIEQQLEDAVYSPFPQVRWTERPDTAVAALLQGKIIAMVSGFPAILICPGLFTEFLQSPEDYYERTVFSSLTRMLRLIAFVISLMLPSIYIALTTFHPELIPSILLLSILNSREGIPFPSLVEAVLMEFFFELLREAGVRLPRPTGSAVSIVGALVIGEAAINAGIASPIMVVVVALTGIASFSLPQYSIGVAFRILRFPMMVLAATMGGFGIMIGSLLILVHLMSLRALGQPYMSPIGPLRLREWRDVIIRAPSNLRQRQPDK
ncbi:spore germination protein [Paenibacillus beijingensis]|uniref:Spore gernimation protein n=1 Tax=Paenibacillus beijingensis TaxID=1126833 RepID=A0A0D5NKL6_9BACL|nr:spore germination protein [Paenibacillus beijingensis]AJY75894.1 spore gernimation protein [Paenibacillus beijingensis]